MPFHSTRKWCVKDVASPKLLAESLTKMSYCGCVGFRCNGFLWLNDSDHGGSIQEWALVRESDGRQCESITIGWIDDEDMEKEIEKYQMKFENGREPMLGEGNMLKPSSLDHPDSCWLCA